MGATSIKSRILDLLSDVVIDNTAIGQFATDAAKEIVNVLPLEMLWSMSTAQTIHLTNGVTVTSSRVLSVNKGGKLAREIPFSDRTRYSEAASIYNATNNSPVYYKQGGKVFILPTSTGTAQVETVSYPVINYSDDLSSFVGAPDEIEHLIILKTAIKARMSELNEFQDDTEEHNLKMADLQILQREYEGALGTFIAAYSKPSQPREEA